MSVKAMGWVWDLDIPRDEKYLLLAYADHADHDGHNIYPAVEKMAIKTGYSERSVQRITRKLEERGLLIPEGKSRLQTNKYSIPIYGGDKMTPPISGGVTNDAQGGDKIDIKGVTPVSPKPSINHHINHHEEDINFNNMVGVISKTAQLVPMNDKDAITIDKFIQAGVIEDDIIQAKKWRDENKLPPWRSVASMSNGVMTTHSIRTSTRKTGKKEPMHVTDPDKYKQELYKIARMSDE